MNTMDLSWEFEKHARLIIQMNITCYNFIWGWEWFPHKWNLIYMLWILLRSSIAICAITSKSYVCRRENLTTVDIWRQLRLCIDYEVSHYIPVNKFAYQDSPISYSTFVTVISGSFFAITVFWPCLVFDNLCC